MQNKINFKINNFGPINEANININQINILGGVNGSGKSLSSKLLFCFLTSLSNQGKLIENSGILASYESFINRWIDNFPKSKPDSIQYNFGELIDEINSLMITWQEDNINYEYLIGFFSKFENILNKYELLNNESCKNELDLIKNSIDINKDRYGYIVRVINYLLLVEFGKSQIKFYKDAIIEFGDEFDNLFNYKLTFNENSYETSFNNQMNLNNYDFKNIIYIDSPSLLNFYIKSDNGLKINGNTGQFHYYNLLKGLISKRDNNSIAIEELYYQNSKNLESELIDMIGGCFEFNDETSKFIFKTDNNEYDIINIASGYKQIGILQLLLTNKVISEGDWIIFDEPEINLHPGMQIKLAELLVKMAAELNICIYINSHSPYIIEAFEVYSKQYNVDNKTSFFLSELIDNNSQKFDIREIECENLEILYDNLAEPYHIINKVRFDNEWNEEFE
ncbi:AAA family ATPase [Methanobrevibacter sp.]|uniref:AAA family ATPase n=1 Tax=Methanobrevibacter sp. TaxID=66852 RepID=UPI00388D480B